MVSLIPINQSRSLDYEFNSYENQKVSINYINNFNEPDTLYHFLKSNKEMSRFFDILTVSNLDYEYTDSILHKTLFVTGNEYIKDDIYNYIIENNDIELARAIIKYNTLSYKISYQDMIQSERFYIKSNYKECSDIKLDVITDIHIDHVILNKSSKIIIGNMKIGNNAVIHLLDNLLLPKVLL